MAVVAFAGAANAETNACVRPYVSLKGTYSKLEMDGRAYDISGTFKTAKTDWVWGGSAAVGVKMCAFRAELEYNQTLSTAKDTRAMGTAAGDTTRGSQTYRSYMANAYFDIPTYTPIHPYAMAGLGMARVKNRVLNLNTDEVTKRHETNFAWQVGGGIGYNLTCNWTLDVGYRWVDNGRSKWGNTKMDSTEHQITAGVRYTF